LHPPRGIPTPRHGSENDRWAQCGTHILKHRHKPTPKYLGSISTPAVQCSAAILRPCHVMPAPQPCYEHSIYFPARLRSHHFHLRGHRLFLTNRDAIVQVTFDCCNRFEARSSVPASFGASSSNDPVTRCWPPMSPSPGLREQLKPAKNKSTERIDDIVALISAIGRAMLAQEAPSPHTSCSGLVGAPAERLIHEHRMAAHRLAATDLLRTNPKSRARHRRMPPHPCGLLGGRCRSGLLWSSTSNFDCSARSTSRSTSCRRAWSGACSRRMRRSKLLAAEAVLRRQATIPA
jgi:hypothetical protein